MPPVFIILLPILFAPPTNDLRPSVKVTFSALPGNPSDVGNFLLSTGDPDDSPPVADLIPFKVTFISLRLAITLSNCFLLTSLSSSPFFSNFNWSNVKLLFALLPALISSNNKVKEECSPLSCVVNFSLTSLPATEEPLLPSPAIAGTFSSILLM